MHIIILHDTIRNFDFHLAHKMAISIDPGFMLRAFKAMGCRIMARIKHSLWSLEHFLVYPFYHAISHIFEFIVQNASPKLLFLTKSSSPIIMYLFLKYKQDSNKLVSVTYMKPPFSPKVLSDEYRHVVLCLSWCQDSCVDWQTNPKVVQSRL